MANNLSSTTVKRCPPTKLKESFDDKITKKYDKIKKDKLVSSLKPQNRCAHIKSSNFIKKG